MFEKKDEGSIRMPIIKRKCLMSKDAIMEELAIKDLHNIHPKFKGARPCYVNYLKIKELCGVII